MFVTHDQDEALELADRVAVLNGGRIEQVGTPDEVQGAPATPFVMTFLGDAVRLEATVQDGRVVIGGRVTSFPPPAGVLGPVAAYRRPWDMRLEPPETADVTGRVRGVDG